MVEDDDEIDEERIPGKYFLIGRLFSIRPFNSQALINTLTKIWKSAKDLTVDTIDNNCFLFKLSGRGDIDRILEGRRWFFERHVLLLEEIGPAAQPRNMVLETTPFWLRLYDLPISAWRERIVQRLASRVGEVKQVHYSEVGEIGGRYARVQVELLVRKPLVRGVPSKSGDLKQVLISFKYERLQQFCYKCGCLGHVD